MQSVLKSLGAQRYAHLQSWLESPAQRARLVLAVTAADWWPDGVAPPTHKAARRMAGRRHAAVRQRGVTP